MSRKKAPPKKEVKHLGIRLTPDLHAKVKDLADREHRSLAAQVITILEKHLREVEGRG